MRAGRIILLLFLFMGLCLDIALISVEKNDTIRAVEVITFAENAKLPIVPRSLSVGGDERIFMPSHLGGFISVFQKNGENSGRKNFIIYKDGSTYNPDEKKLSSFNQEQIQWEPTFCSFDVRQDTLNVFDKKNRKLYTFKQNENQFHKISELDAPFLGSDARVGGDGLIYIAGYTKDESNNAYELYSVPLSGDVKKTRYILPAHQKYSLSKADYEEMENKRKRAAIGIKALLDINNSHALFAWEGSLDLKLIQLSNNKITSIDYKKQKNDLYRKPDGAQFTSLYENGKYDALLTKRGEYSYLAKVFLSKKYIYAVYSVPGSYQQRTNFRIRKYNYNGDLQADEPIPGNSSGIMHFDPTGNNLYCLVSVPHGSSEKMVVRKYKIME